MKLPGLVYRMCREGALIAGSTARVFAGVSTKTPDDWDLLVPFERWNTVALLIPPGARTNKFGGWKFPLDCGNLVDVWPGSVQEHLQNACSYEGGSAYVYDPLNNRVFSIRGVLRKEG